MSKYVNKNQVFKTTRVRTTLKSDGCWIQRSKEEKEEQDKERMDQTAESKPVPVRQNSYVLSTAKKFESASPLSPSLPETKFFPSEGNSPYHANGEVFPLQKDAQPGGSTAETTDDTKPQAPTQQLIQNDEEQPEKTVAITTAEKKEEHADAAVDQSNVEQKEMTAEASADIDEQNQNGEAQPVFPTKEEPEAVSPVEPAEQPVANTTAENVQSSVEHNEAEVCADAHVEDLVVENSAAAGPEGNEDTAGVPAALAAEQKPQEERSNQTEPADERDLEDAEKDSAVQPAEGSCGKCPPEQAAEETVEAAAEVVVEASADKSDVINATPGEEAALPADTAEPIPELLAESVSESPTQPAAETAVTSVECNVESAASAGPVLKTTAEAECVVQPVDDTVAKQSAEPQLESAADRAVELNIEDAVEPVASSEAQDKLAYRAIELTDAFDVEPPTAEAPPEPLNDPLQSHTEEPPLNQQSDETSNSEMFEKPVEEPQSTHTTNKPRVGKALCLFCDKIIDGHVKITFSEPAMICHPDCLKCGVCAKALGDMLSPMFFHNQAIQCGGCFAKALNI